VTLAPLRSQFDLLAAQTNSQQSGFVIMKPLAVPLLRFDIKSPRAADFPPDNSQGAERRLGIGRKNNVLG
jgi:hypothetical protein